LNYKEFFKLLGNPNPRCFIKDTNPDIIIPIQVSDIDKYIEKKELYFIPNEGGTKTKDIKKFNCFFVDIDCGRDENKNYFPDNVVNNFKRKQYEKLKNFQICPNVLCETKNGYHAYWFLKEKITLEQWNEIEQYLVNKFGADQRVKNAAQKMRIPFTYWVKDAKNPFFCKAEILSTKITYIASYCKMLKSEQKQDLKPKKQDLKFLPLKTSFSSVNPSKAFISYKELFDYLTKEVSMFDYLKKYHHLNAASPTSFKCIFHDDENPSANIFKTDNGTELYCCHSSSCGFTGNIIQLVAYLNGCSRSSAVQIICLRLNLKYQKNSELVDLIFDNMQSIEHDIEFSHRDLYGLVYRYLPTLKALHFAAFENLLYANNDKEFLFSASTNYIAKLLGRCDKKNTGADISLLCLLKMIDKVDLDGDVPEDYKSYIRRFQGEQSKHINVYSLPSYTYDMLTECNAMAKQVKEKNLRKKHFTYESVANAFGVETANRVFPQVKNKEVKEVDAFLLETIQHLLDRDGYFTQSTVFDQYRERKKFFKENLYIKQIPAITQMLDLERVKASKKLKEKYNILIAGYPYLFIKKQGD